MTRKHRRKSDAQLDAEAAVQSMLRRAHRLPPLTAWRAAVHDEVPSRLTGRHPALLVDGDNAAMIEASQVGVDFTAALIDYIDAGFPTDETGKRIGAHGKDPVHDALLLWDRECRRRHARWPDHRGRAACATIAWAVLRDRTSLAFAAEQAGVSYPRAERLLHAAVAWMRKRQERWLGDTDMSAGHDPEYCRVCRGEAA